MKTYDAIVIGAGPGGYVAAIRLGQLGHSVLVVEKEHVGGVCLNWGCIPSKALIAAASTVHKIRAAADIGIAVDGVRVDWPKMQGWKDGIVKRLGQGVRGLVRGAGGEIVAGTAKLKSPRLVEVTSAEGKAESYEATKAVVIATGARPIDLPDFRVDGRVVITAKEAVSLDRIPARLAVIGGGVIGLELGMVYQKLGSKLIVVELTSQLLPGIDADLVKVVEKHLRAAGAEILLETKASWCKVEAQKARIRVEQAGGAREIDADAVLVAVGFRPSSAGLGLEQLGVALDARGHVTTDETMQTNVRGVYAIGDVSGGPYLAHKASKEGEIAAEVIAGRKAARDWRAMPAAVFTDPEIAVVGMGESRAREGGRAVRVGKFPFAVSGRAMAVRETDGFIKVIADDKTHEILGVGIVGPEASDLIGEAALALEMCAYVEDVALTVHPHPTLSEGMMEAMKHALGEAIHVMNR